MDTNELIRALEDSHWEIRRDAARTLGKVRCVQAVRDLAAVVEDPVPDVRKAALEAIRNIGPDAKEAVPALVKTLQKDKGNCSSAAWTLAAIGPAAREAIPTLVRELRIPFIREHFRVDPRSVISALQAMGPDARTAIPALVSFVNDCDKVDHYKSKYLNESLSAVRALKSLGAAAIPALIGLLKEHLTPWWPLTRWWYGWEDYDREVAMAVADALGQLKAKGAVSALVEMFCAKGHEDKPRVVAAKALGEIGPSAGKAVRALTKALEDKSATVQEAAANALESIIGTSRI